MSTGMYLNIQKHYESMSTCMYFNMQKHYEYSQQLESVEGGSVSRPIASQPDILLTVQVYRSYVKRKVMALAEQHCS